MIKLVRKFKIIKTFKISELKNVERRLKKQRTGAGKEKQGAGVQKTSDRNVIKKHVTWRLRLR